MPTPKLKAEYDRLHPRDGVYDPTIHAFDYPEAPEAPKVEAPKDRAALAFIVCGLSILAIVALTVTA